MSPTPYPFLKLFNGILLLKGESVKPLKMVYKALHSLASTYTSGSVTFPPPPHFPHFSHFLEPSMPMTSGPDLGALEGSFISYPSSPNKLLPTP